MPRKRVAQRNPLDGKTANVSVARNGLQIDVLGVDATDSAQVAAILLSALRDMIAKGYGELVQDAGGVHGGVFGEVPDDSEYEEARRVGFTN